MRAKALWMITATFVLGVAAIAAISLGPSNLANLGAPFPTPIWLPGDSWTYDVNASSRDSMSGGPYIAGTLTHTVVSADASQYNVSVHGSFHVGGLIDVTHDADLANASMILQSHVTLDDATVDGHSWYRASDLAKVKDVRTVHLGGSLQTDIGDFTASYAATIETTYDPALDIWSFPIDENETWNVSSNATIRAWTQWRLEGPNEYFEFGRNFTVTVPIRLIMMSGTVEDVTTPAGTFSSIPVRVALPAHDLDTTDEHLGVVTGLGGGGFAGPHAPAEAWFSPAVGNVAKAVILVDGARIDVVLTAYHRS